MILAGFKLILGQAHLYRRSLRLGWVATLMVVLSILMAIGALLVASITGDMVLAARVLCWPALFLVLMYWFAIANVIQLLNTPANDQLVPGSRRNATMIMALLWPGSVVVLGGLFGYAFGNYLLMASCFGLGLAGVAMLGAGCKDGLLPYAALLLYYFFPSDERIAGLVSMQPMILVLTLSFWLYAMRRMFARGDRHWSRLADMEQARDWQIGDWPLTAIKHGQGPTRRLYDAILAHDSKKANSTSALLSHLLGPNLHWITMLVSSLQAAALLVAVLWLGPLLDLHVTLRPQLLTSIAIAMLVIEPIWRDQAVSAALRQSVIESQLLVLAPRIPQQQSLNRVLGKRMLWQGLAHVFQWLALVSLGAALAGVSLVQLATILSIASPAILMNAGTLGRLAKPVRASSWGALDAGILQVGMLYAAFGIVNATVPLSWHLLALASIGVAVAIAASDWRKLINGPAVLPVRLASAIQ